MKSSFGPLSNALEYQSSMVILREELDQVLYPHSRQCQRAVHRLPCSAVRGAGPRLEKSALGAKHADAAPPATLTVGKRRRCVVVSGMKR